MGIDSQNQSLSRVLKRDGFRANANRNEKKETLIVIVTTEMGLVAIMNLHLNCNPGF